MFGQVAAFEFRQQLRSPLFWIVTGIVFLLVFGVMATENVHIGDSANVHKNSPYMIVQTHLIMSMFFMFASTAFVAGSVLRDDETGFGPILRAAPLTKFDYLYGRFFGAFGATALSFVAVPLAMTVGAWLPWVDPEKLGPFRGDAMLMAYFVYALPVLLLTSALFFTTATVARSMAWSFVAAIALVVIYSVSLFLLSKPEFEPLLSRWDPFGLSAFFISTEYWTASDRNTLLVPLVGNVFFNRFFALALGATALAAAYPLFRYRATPGGKGSAAPSALNNRPAATVIPISVIQRFDRKAALAQFVARARFDMGQILKSPVFWIILGMGMINAGLSLWAVTDDTRYGGALLPATRVLIPVLEGSFYFFSVILAGFYAGELVWRDRDRRANEMIDATPAPDWTFIVPKTVAVILVLFATLIVSVLAAMIVQALKGYYAFEPEKYLLWYLLPHGVDLAIIAALAIFTQALLPNKFWGWGAMILYIVMLSAAPGLGIEHNLLVFGHTNPVPLSDMNGQGRFWVGAWWFRLYWSAWALSLLIIAYALWRRGTESRLAPRLARAPAAFRGPLLWASLAVILIGAGSGGFIFYNTNVLNPYRTKISDDQWQADYEKALLPYEKVPQPSVVRVTLNVAINPHIPSLETRGVYVLENLTGAPLRQVHVRFDRPLSVRALSVEGARPIKVYDRFNYRIFAFDTPMQPGERRSLSFDTVLTQHGFRTARSDTRDLTEVVDNGTFANSFQIAPLIGMTRDRLLTDRAIRRRNGLPAELHMAPLGDLASRNTSVIGGASWSQADITVSTDADQTPIAPGYKVYDKTVGGRRTARFVTEAPILQFFSIQSARYQVRTQTYKGIDLSVYFDPQHATNVDRMLRAMRVSLDYYQANFSPYQFRQARITEFPDYAQFAQSFAGTFPWSEGLGFIADYRDPSRIDLVTYVAAHEFAHQWWAHQVIPANQQGASLLTETMAQYSALRVMREIYGPDKVRKFLKFELDSYLRNRGAEAMAEQPLERVEDQGYIHYRKGSLVMYRLADEIGEDAVNRALRTMIARFAFKGAPYPTALDLVAAFRAQAPADKQSLITDLFEKITLYDLKATKATARRRADGLWDVQLKVTAVKYYADGLGKQREASLNETMWVGLFEQKPDEKSFGPGDVIAMQKRQVRSGDQTFAFVTHREPKFAGIDPYDEVIDRNSETNTRSVN